MPMKKKESAIEKYSHEHKMGPCGLSIGAISKSRIPVTCT